MPVNVSPDAAVSIGAIAAPERGKLLRGQLYELFPSLEQISLKRIHHLIGARVASLVAGTSQK
jgi:hypothetical protein